MPADPAGSRIKADYKSGRESVHVRFHVAGFKSALWGFHTRATQRQDNDKVRQTRCERHHRNAQVQHLSCRCFVVVLLWCENTITLNKLHCITRRIGKALQVLAYTAVVW